VSRKLVADKVKIIPEVGDLFDANGLWDSFSFQV
jgi:hypothetical protein